MTAATKNVSVKLDSKLYTALKTRAELNGSNVSDEIRSLLRSALATEGLDLYGNEVADFIRGVVDARMDVAALDIERKLDAAEDRIAAVLSRPMTAAIMAGLMSAPEHPSARGAVRLLQGRVGRAAGAARHPGRPLG